MAGMGASLKVLMRGFRTGRIVDSLRILALEVWREDTMNNTAMNMARISVMMICLRMHMEERNHEHPYGDPHKNEHPSTRSLVTFLSHCEVTLAQFPSPSNLPVLFVHRACAEWRETGPRQTKGGRSLRPLPPFNPVKSLLLIRLWGIAQVGLYTREAFREKRLGLSIVHSRGDNTILPVLPISRRRNLELRGQLKRVNNSQEFIEVPST